MSLAKIWCLVFFEKVIDFLDTRGTETRLQTTFSHCFLTLETTKKRLETRDYKKMRFRRAAAVTFFLGATPRFSGQGYPIFSSALRAAMYSLCILVCIINII